MGSTFTENNINCIEIDIQRTVTVGFQCGTTLIKHLTQEAIEMNCGFLFFCLEYTLGSNVTEPGLGLDGYCLNP